MKSGIYKIECVPTGKFYIGSAVNFGSRWSMHRHHLERGKHHSIHLQRAWNKHGEGSFAFSVIEQVSTDRLIEREQYYLDTLQPFGERGFNISPTAGSSRGARRTPEQIERMAARNRGKVLTPEHRAKIGAAHTGMKRSAETRRKISEARFRNNGQRGKPLNERQKAALFKSGADHPWFGRKHSEASKRKASLTKSHPVVQCNEDGGVVRIWAAASEAATALGLKWADSIHRAVNNPAKRAAGFRWQRATTTAI